MSLSSCNFKGGTIMYEKLRRFEYVGEIIIGENSKTILVQATQEYCKDVQVLITTITSSEIENKTFKTKLDFFTWLDKLDFNKFI